MARARLSLTRGTTATCRSAMSRSSCRNPSASPIRTPVSSSSANNNRSRRCSHASRIACASPAVSTRGRGTGAGSVIVRRRCGALLVTWCRNGLNEVAERPAAPPAGAMVTSSPASGTPCRAWNSQNEVNAASLRFTLAAVQ